MKILIQILIYTIVVEHFYFFILESFLWTKKRTRKIFGLKDLEFAKETKVLAANQGIYNSFLAIGLLVSSIVQNQFFVHLFLGFVLVAGIFGALTTRKIRLFWVQGFPALLTLLLNYYINK